MLTAVLFILMMLVLIAPHEFGHFIVAKLCNVQVNEFAVGMGPVLFHKTKGETTYSLRLIPIGGYCAMEGEENSSNNPRAFNNKKPLQKAAILLAGVTMNVVIAILACTIAYQITGIPVNKLDSVVKDSPASVAELQAGDSIVSVDGVKTSSWQDVTNEINQYEGDGSIEIIYNRDGTDHIAKIQPEYDKDTQRYTVGIVASLSKNPVLATKYGLLTTGDLTKSMFDALSLLVKKGIGKDDISGPVGLVKIVGQASSAGVASYLILLALVSLNLAFINLIPIPGLDGGKLLFVILKWITRGKINDNMEYKASIIGILLLLGIFVLVTINDISNLF